MNLQSSLKGSNYCCSPSPDKLRMNPGDAFKKHLKWLLLPHMLQLNRAASLACLVSISLKDRHLSSYLLWLSGVEKSSRIKRLELVLDCVGHIWLMQPKARFPAAFNAAKSLLPFVCAFNAQHVGNPRLASLNGAYPQNYFTSSCPHLRAWLCRLMKNTRLK